MNPDKFQSLILPVVLMVIVILFVAVLVLLSATSLSPTERNKIAEERRKRLNPISALPSSLDLPPASNTPTILRVSPDKIDVEVDEMGVHIVTTPILKVWRDRKTGKPECERLAIR